MADYLPILIMAGLVVAFVMGSFVASQLLAPQRPNGILSWMDGRTVSTWTTSVRINVSLSRRTLVLIRLGKVVTRVPLEAWVRRAAAHGMNHLCRP